MSHADSSVKKRVRALLPAIVAFFATALFIARFGIDVPYWDDWNMAEFLLRVRSHGIDFSELVATHNEGRLVVTRLLAILAMYVHAWDKRLFMAMSLAAATGTLIFLHRVARRTIGEGAFIATGVAGVLMLSLLQFMNWMWAFQLALFLPALCLSAGLAVATGEGRPFVRLGVCAALAMLATYSFTNGMFVWGLLLPVLWLDRRIPRRMLCAVWGISAMIALGLYFRHFHQVGYTTPWGQVIRNPIYLVRYALAFLGTASGCALWTNNPRVSIVCGTAIMALAGWCAVYVVQRWRDRDFMRRAMPWIVYCAYPMACALAAAVGRSDPSLGNAMAYRYFTFSLQLPVGIVFLAALLFDDIRNHSRMARNLARVGTVAVIALTVAQIPRILERAQVLRTMRLQGMGGLQLSELGVNPSVRQKMNPFDEHHRIAEIAAALDDAGMFFPHVWRTTEMSAIAVPKDDAIYGMFEQLAPDEQGWTATGWAILPDRPGPADDVVIAAIGADKSERAIAYEDNFIDRPAVADAMHNLAYLRSTWTIRISRERVPAGTVALSAWAYDTRIGKAHRLAESKVPR